MPGTIRVQVLGARDLPIMDKSADTTDAFVEVRFGETCHKTSVCPKSLSPRWEAEWFVFEAEDIELQDESLQFRVMDYDTYSANDAIGRVYLDLGPLIEAAHRLESEIFLQKKPSICPETLAAAAETIEYSNSDPTLLHGWFPIMDTMTGVRGELEVRVKLDMFSDKNQCRQSSCGIKIFSSPVVPCGMELECVQGYIFEVLTAGDPEYQWLDRIRSPRASNEARLLVFRNLSSEMARKLGRKAMNLGGNAILGYSLKFDLEGEETGLIVLRGSGTSITLKTTVDVPVLTIPSVPPSHKASTKLSPEILDESMSPVAQNGCPDVETTVSAELKELERSVAHQLTKLRKHSKKQNTPLLKQLTAPELELDSADEVLLSKASSYTGPVGEGRGPDLPFLSVHSLPLGFVQGRGGLVSARSVRLLEEEEDKESLDAAYVRSSWLVELREELRSHVRSLGCNALLGYSEEVAIRKDVVVLSASGTAVVMSSSLWSSKTPLLPKNPFAPSESNKKQSVMLPPPCSQLHVSFADNELPFPLGLRKCAMCGEKLVGDLVLSTCRPPPGLVVQDEKPCLIQVPVIRKISEHDGEDLATEISGLLPFVEHQLHSGLLSELKSKGGGHRNAIFSLKTSISIGDGVFLAIMSGMAHTLLNILPDNVLTAQGHKTKKKFLFGRRVEDIPKAFTELEGRSTSFVSLEEQKLTAKLSTGNQPNVANPAPTKRNLPAASTFLAESAPFLSKFFEDSTGKHQRLRGLPVFLLYHWKGFNHTEDAHLLDPNSDEGRKKTKTEGLIKNAFSKILVRPRKVEDKIPVFLRNTMLSVGIVGELPLSPSPSPTSSSELHAWNVLCGIIFTSPTALGDKVNVPMTTAPDLPLAKYPGTRTFLGKYDTTFIRECSNLKELGGLDAFVRLTAAEIFHGARSQALSVGGTGIVSLRLTLRDLSGSVGKNQAQCLLGLLGDIVRITP